MHQMNAEKKHKITYSYSFLNHSLRAPVPERKNKTDNGASNSFKYFQFCKRLLSFHLKKYLFMLYNKSKSIRRSAIKVMTRIFTIRTMYISDCKSEQCTFPIVNLISFHLKNAPPYD